MKILLSLTLSLFLLIVPASAAQIEEMNTDMTVNALMKNGWKLHTVSSSDYIITYTLIRKDDVITCKVDSRGGIECFKP